MPALATTLRRRLAPIRRPARQLTSRDWRGGDGSPRAAVTLLGWWDMRRSRLATNFDGTGGVPANGGSLGYIADLSGRGHHLTANSDNSGQTVHIANFLDYGFPAYKTTTTSTHLFSTATGLVTPLSGIDKPYTVIAVVGLDTEVVQNTVTFAFGTTASGNPTTQGRLDPGLSTTASRPILRCVRTDDANQTDTIDSDAGWGGAGLNVIAYSFDGTTIKMYQNGVLAKSEAIGTSAGAQAVTTFTWGQFYRSGATGVGTGPHMMALALFSGAMSDVQVSQMSRTMQGDYRIPWAASPGSKLVYFLCDSHIQRTLSQHGAQQMYRRIARDGTLDASETVRIINRGVQGSAVDREAATITWSAQPPSPDAEEQWADNKAAFVAGSLMIFIGGGNDTRLDTAIVDGATATAAAAALIVPYMAIVAEAIEVNGGDVIGLSVSPQDSGSTDVNKRQAILEYNELLHKKLSNFDRAFYSDHFALTKTGTTPFSLATEFQADGLHFNAAGLIAQGTPLRPFVTQLRHKAVSRSTCVRYFTSSTGTVFADGGAVGGTALPDLSAANEDASQGTAGFRPLWQEGEVSTYAPVIDFDGTDDTLAFTSIALTAWTITLVANADDYGSVNPIVGRSSSTASVQFTSATQTVVQCDTGALTFTHAARASGDIITVRSDKRCWLNGVEATLASDTTAGGVVTITLDRIGSNSAAFFDGKLFLVCIDNVALKHNVINKDGWYRAAKLTNMGISKTWTQIMS